MTDLWLDQYGQELRPTVPFPRALTVQPGDFVEYGDGYLEVTGKTVDLDYPKGESAIVIRTHPLGRPEWARPEKVSKL